MLTDVMDSDEYDIPWERLFYVSSDGPNINKVMWRNLKKNERQTIYKGLAALIICTLNILCTMDLGKEQVLMVSEKLQIGAVGFQLTCLIQDIFLMFCDSPAS